MRYWLMKSEPETFSIDDLAQKGTESWDGIRNYQARNSMRDEMRIGDQILFYHSSTKLIGIAGLAEVSSTPYPDPTQFDQKSEYFDPKSSPENPRWYLVDVTFKQKFNKVISLDTLCKNPTTATMRVCQRGNRLSITPVTKLEYTAALALAETSA